MSRLPAPAIWEARNLAVTSAFAPLLVLTGALGFMLPPARAVLSGAPAYNLFHIAAGLVGIGLVLGSGSRGAVGFNLAFGLNDLYQAVAGSLDLFPAALFAFLPLDDVLHVGLGLGLVGLGALGRGRGPSPGAAGADPARGGSGIGLI